MADYISRCEHITLNNEEVVPLTLNFKKMLWLKANGYKNAVDAAMNAINGKSLDFLEMPFVLWAAYLCAVDKPEYTEDEFIELLPWDLEEVATIFTALNSKKKK